MKILIVGGGGREHAIAEKLAENPKVTKLYAAPGNGGLAEICELVPLKATDVEGIVDFCSQEKMDFVVVAQDDPLCLGMVDALANVGIPAFGPTKQAAMIEGSKAFAKDLMKKYGIPTAEYETFKDPQAAISYVQAQTRWPLVVKADGLALGKGVVICQDAGEAEAAVRSMMLEDRFGASGRTVVVETFLTGPEVSVLAFTDGETVVPMVSSMDHKRALDGDRGLNTGGMGTVAPNPYYTEAIAEECMAQIFLPTIRAMRDMGCPFKGCLYFGLMLTADGPKVIEYNCRFGDPETQVVLPLLKSDLLTIMEATVKGTLAETPVVFSAGSACCVVLASGGYPVSYKTGYPISGLEEAGQMAHIYHAGTKQTEAGTVTSGGRVLGVTATADTLKEAIQRAYTAADFIHFEDMHMRRDIGQRALQAEERA